MSTCQAKTLHKRCEFANTKQHLPSKIIVILGVCVMGNKRSVRNRHISNGCNQKRTYQRISEEECIPVENREPNVEFSCETNSMMIDDGSRIVNISQLEKYLDELTHHVSQCDNAGKVMLTAEKKDGLASVISTQCSSCGFKINLQTSRKVCCVTGYSGWEVNIAAVWGQMTTGGGHSTLTESMAYLDVPVMAKKSFITTERTIGEWWRERLQQSMVEAGRQERECRLP